MACKPDSVPGKPRAVVIHLGPPLPTASSGLPEPQAPRATASAPIWPCSGRGLPSRPCHQGRWWALTPPFHPYPSGPSPRRAVSLSVALSVGSPRLGVTQLPALWSPDFPRARRRRARDHPADSLQVHYPTMMTGLQIYRFQNSPDGESPA